MLLLVAIRIFQRIMYPINPRTCQLCEKIGHTAQSYFVLRDIFVGKFVSLPTMIARYEGWS